MNLVRNIILALCLSLNFGENKTRFSIKPSVYLMPEIVFTNQANYNMVKETKVPKINPPALNLFDSKDQTGVKSGFQLKMTLPDLAVFFVKNPINKSINKLRIEKLDYGQMENDFEVASRIDDDQLVFTPND